METPKHLGGHAGITHIDIGALSWAISRLSIKSARDIGCGVGDMVKLMLDRNIDAYGIEGDPTLNWGRPDRFIRHDYTLDSLITDKYDLTWCVEVLEHIEEKYLPNLFETIKSSKYVIVTAAPPGTEAAHHHVNCKDQEYWIAKFEEFDFELDAEKTAELRAASTMTRNFMRETGMVFCNVAENKEVASEDWKELEKEMLKPKVETEVKIETKVETKVETEVKVETKVKPKVEADGRLCHPITNMMLRDNQDLITEDGKLYIVTLTKNGHIRKGSKKFIEI